MLSNHSSSAASSPIALSLSQDQGKIHFSMSQLFASAGQSIFKVDFF